MMDAAEIIKEDLQHFDKDEEKNGYLFKALQDSFKEDLFATAKYLLGYKEVTRETHGPIVDVLQSDSKRKLIVVPRGCFKSSLCSIAYPIWLLIKNPNLRILIDSEVYMNSSKFLREIKAHLICDEIVKLYGQFYNPANWNEGEITIKQRNIIKKEGSITASGIGAQKTSRHFDVIIADDMNSPDNSQTHEGREKVIDHYRYYTSLLDPGGIIVIVGTRYAAEDLIGHIIVNEIQRGATSV